VDCDNLVDELIRLSRYDGEQPGPINIGNPVELTVSDRVIALTGTDAELVYRPLPIDDPRRRRPDISKAKQLLKWQPRVALQEGLEQTIAWIAREVDRPAQRPEVVSAALLAE